MAVYVAVITRELPNCSRDQDKTYVDVLTRVTALGAVTSLAQWLAEHPLHEWNSATGATYAVEISEADYNSLINSRDVFYDGRPSLPKWQQLDGETGDTKAFGSYSDPTDNQSTWNLGVQVPDDRYILRVYDDDPVTNPSATHIGEEEFDEVPAGLVTRYIRLFSYLDAPLANNSANQRTEVGGKLMDFDFGSSHDPALSAGVTTFKLALDNAGEQIFNSNHRYRFIGPNAGLPNYWRGRIFGKILRVVPEF